MKLRVSKWEWIVFLAVLAMLCCAFFTGCAVPVRNENNDKPLLTAPTGKAVTKADGTVVYNPHLPQPDAKNYEHTDPVDWMGIARIVLEIALGLGAGQAISLRGRLKRAEVGEDEGWDHALKLAKQVQPPVES